MRTLVALLCLSVVAVAQEPNRETTNPVRKGVKELYASFPKECIPEGSDDMTPIQTKLAEQWGKDQVAVPIEFDAPLKVQSISTGDGDVFIELVAEFKKGASPIKTIKQYTVTCRISEKDTAALRQAASIKVGKPYKVTGKVERILTQSNFSQIILLIGPKIEAY